MTGQPPGCTLFPYTTLFRSHRAAEVRVDVVGKTLAQHDLDRFRHGGRVDAVELHRPRVLPRSEAQDRAGRDRKSTRLNSSHVKISYAVFCLKKKRGSSVWKK